MPRRGGDRSGQRVGPRSWSAGFGRECFPSGRGNRLFRVGRRTLAVSGTKTAVGEGTAGRASRRLQTGPPVTPQIRRARGGSGRARGPWPGDRGGSGGASGCALRGLLRGRGRRGLPGAPPLPPGGVPPRHLGEPRLRGRVGGGVARNRSPPISSPPRGPSVASISGAGPPPRSLHTSRARSFEPAGLSHPATPKFPPRLRAARAELQVVLGPRPFSGPPTLPAPPRSLLRVQWAAELQATP